MDELRYDFFKRFGVIYSPLRAKRPIEWQEPVISQDQKSCPFCEGNEKATPPEVFALSKKTRKANKGEWLFRVVPNKYPAFPQISPKEKNGHRGIHFVIIESPHHNASYSTLELSKIETLWRGISQIYQIYEEKFPHLNWLLFKNQGYMAGASLSHPHSQWVGLPFLTPFIKTKLDLAPPLSSSSCSYCQYLKESQNSPRLLWEDESFIVFFPYATRSPYEISIYSKNHIPSPAQMGDKEIKKLAQIWQWIFQRLETLHGPFSFNYLLYSLPRYLWKEKEFHWHIEIIPRLSQVAGFEWGTGFFLNSLYPEEGCQNMGKPFFLPESHVPEKGKKA